MPDKRIALGKLANNNYGLQISKAGSDVIDDTINTRDLLFNSLDTYRSGVIVSDTTISGTMSSSGVALPTTADSSGTAYIPAYQIIEKGVKSNFTQFQETTTLSFAGVQHTLEATVAGALPTSAGGGMFELSLDGSSSTLNLVRPTLFDITEVENPTGSVNGNYPYIEYRSRGSSDGNVDILALRIPCQYGKMTNNAALFGNSELTPSATGGGGSGGAGVVSAPADPTVTLSSRNNTNDTVVVSSSSGSGNSGTITFAQTSTNVTPTSGFTTTTTYTQPRNSTRYYWASQSSTVSGSTAFVSPAVDTSPNAFTFTDVANVSRNSTNTSDPPITISGMGTGDTATVSLSGTAGSKQYSKNGGAYTSSSGTAQNGDTFAVRGTASGSYSSTVTVILTVGSTADTYSITTEGEPADTTPSAFDFTNQSDLNLSTLTYSNTQTISGINQSVSVSATNGAQFSINGGGYTTSGSISNGQSLRVRLTSSGSYSTSVSTTITVGGTTDVWAITTRAQAQATTPTFQGVTLQTNTSSSSQTVRAAAIVQSGDTLQIKVESGGSWANATSTYSSDFSQNRNTSVTYYFRAVSTDGHISSEVSASFYIPPIHAVQSIADISFANGSHDNTYSVTSSLNGGAAILYTSKSFSITESASWITATIANSTTGTMRLQISANTGIARSATVTYTISSTNGGPNVSASFTVSQAAVTPPVTAIWEVNIAQGAYSTASFNSQGYHPFTGGGHGSFSNTTNTIASINSGGGNWAFNDIESQSQNTIFLIFTSSAANSGWTTLKVYNGTNTSGALLGTFTRTSLTYTGTGGTAAWNLGSDVTTNTGNRFLQFS
jgi:hypothetical protein